MRGHVRADVKEYIAVPVVDHSIEQRICDTDYLRRHRCIRGKFRYLVDILAWICVVLANDYIDDRVRQEVVASWPSIAEGLFAEPCFLDDVVDVQPVQCRGEVADLPEPYGFLRIGGLV